MLTNSSKYRFWVILACLFVFSLSFAPNGSQWTDGLDNSVADSKQVIFTCLTAGSSSVPIAVRERTWLDSFDDLFAVFYRQAYIVFVGNSFSSPADDSSDAINLTDCSIIPIRAPPSLHSLAI